MFLLRNRETFRVCNILQIFKISEFFLSDLLTNKARKLKVLESNQAKVILTKPWLATDKGNRPPAL